MHYETQCNFKKNIIDGVEEILNEVCGDDPKKDSLEWYLKNNLDSYLYSINTNTSSVELEKANKVLRRFCIDSMDWDTEVYKRCSAITNLCDKYIKSLKDSQI